MHGHVLPVVSPQCAGAWHPVLQGPRCHPNPESPRTQSTTRVVPPAVTGAQSCMRISLDRSTCSLHLEPSLVYGTTSWIQGQPRCHVQVCITPILQPCHQKRESAAVERVRGCRKRHAGDHRGNNCSTCDDTFGLTPPKRLRCRLGLSSPRE